MELGYTYLETDVHVTSDGVLLAFHDTVLDRVTDRTGSIADSTYDEVRQAMIGGRERVPTLADLFDAFPGARFNIDLKSEGAVEALARVHRGARGVGPGAGRVVLRPPDERLPPAHGRPGGHLGPPARGGRLRALPQRPARPVAHPRAAGGAAGARTAAVACSWSRAGSYDARTAAGVQVHVWTIDDPIEMNALLDRGVDGIMTDRTDILRDVLRARGQWNGPDQ